MAAKYAEKQILLPINTIWCYYVFTKNADGANKIWTQHLATASEIRYRPVLFKAIRNQDSGIVENLIEYLKSAKVQQSTDLAYSALIDIHSLNGEFERGLNVLDELVKSSSINAVNVETLKRIKTGVEEAGKKFPYEINETNHASYQKL